MYSAMGFLFLSCVVFFCGSLAYTLLRLLRSHLKTRYRAERPRHIDPGSRGQWLASFWDMEAGPGNRDRCFYVHFCPCLAAGEVAKRLGGSYALDCCFGGVGGLYVGYYPCVWAFTRTKLRMQFGIAGNWCSDFWLIALFPCCYLAQALNHLDISNGVEAPVPRCTELLKGNCAAKDPSPAQFQQAHPLPVISWRAAAPQVGGGAAAAVGAEKV